jgi:GPN-loop GTPase
MLSDRSLQGSGKTTFMQRINAYLHEKKQPPYVLNLDPAVLSVPFEANIDIRDSINYKEVMKQYNLGPNGGILTSLNLFTTKVDQILSLMEKRSKPSPETKTRPPCHFLVDTPGQIEVFVWSASGSILLESLASSFPTVIAYIIDTPRASSTSTFMSNMLYACSILYKTKLPMILVFNKTDVQEADFAHDWMTDFEKFQAALRDEERRGVFGGEGFGGGSGYMSSLLNSMSLMLEEFYSHLSMVAVSSTTGDGVDGFFEAVESKREEFNRDYKPELDRRRKQREADRAAGKETDLTNVLQGLKVSGTNTAAATEGESDDQHNAEGTEEDDDDEEDKYDQDQYPDDTNDESNGGLSTRYKAALKSSGSQGDAGDESFANFLTASQAQISRQR